MKQLSFSRMMSLLIALAVLSAQPVVASLFSRPPSGTIEGTILSDDGRPVYLNQGTSGMVITGQRIGGGGSFRAQSSRQLGGLYRATKLPPGVYDITVPEGMIDNTYYAPEVIHGVVVKQNETTTLNITLSPGSTLKEIDIPAPAPVTVAQLQAQIAALQHQIAALQTQVAALKARETALSNTIPSAR